MHWEASCRAAAVQCWLGLSCLRKEGVACLGALGEPFGVCCVLLNRCGVAPQSVCTDSSRYFTVDVESGTASELCFMAGVGGRPA